MEKAETAKFDVEGADWLALDAFDGSHSRAVGSNFLIGGFVFEQAHVEPNLVNSCEIVIKARFRRSRYMRGGVSRSI